MRLLKEQVAWVLDGICEVGDMASEGQLAEYMGQVLEWGSGRDRSY